MAMAEAIVDALEIVEIQVGHSQRAPISPRSGDLDFCLLEERSRIQCPSEKIRTRHRMLGVQGFSQARNKDTNRDQNKQSSGRVPKQNAVRWRPQREPLCPQPRCRAHYSGHYGQAKLARFPSNKCNSDEIEQG